VLIPDFLIEASIHNVYRMLFLPSPTLKESRLDSLASRYHNPLVIRVLAYNPGVASETPGPEPRLDFDALTPVNSFRTSL